ncbi:hypothetical protein Peur_031900 [Populus x canadensis]
MLKNPYLSQIDNNNMRKCRICKTVFQTKYAELKTHVCALFSLIIENPCLSTERNVYILI